MLLPTLAFWAAGLGEVKTLEELAAFKQDHMKHCSFQLWLPSDDLEDNIYIVHENHGTAFTDIPVTTDPSEVIIYVLRECGRDTPFFSLSPSMSIGADFN